MPIPSSLHTLYRLQGGSRMKRKRIPAHMRSRSADHPSNTFVRVVRKVLPSVVSIVTHSRPSTHATLDKQWLRLFFPDVHVEDDAPKRHYGSGFFIHPAGYVLTNGSTGCLRGRGRAS